MTDQNAPVVRHQAQALAALQRMGDYHDRHHQLAGEHIDHHQQLEDQARQATTTKGET